MTLELPHFLQNLIVEYAIQRNINSETNAYNTSLTIALVCERWFKHVQQLTTNVNLLKCPLINCQFKVDNQYSLLQSKNISSLEFNTLNQAVFTMLESVTMNISSFIIHIEQVGHDINQTLKLLTELVKSDRVEFHLFVNVERGIFSMAKPPNRELYNIATVNIQCGQEVITEEYLWEEEGLASIAAGWRPTDYTLRFNKGGLSTHFGYSLFLTVNTLRTALIETDFVELCYVNSALSGNHLEELEFSYLFHHISGEKHGNTYRNSCFPTMDAPWHKLPDTQQHFKEFCGLLANNRILRDLTIHNFCKQPLGEDRMDENQLLANQFAEVFAHNNYLTSLCLDNIQLVNDEFFYSLHNNRGLKSLRLENGTINNDNLMTSIGLMLSENKHISHLSISNNQALTDCSELAKAITNNNTLRSLDISFCKFKNLFLLFESILNNKTLYTLSISFDMKTSIENHPILLKLMNRFNLKTINNYNLKPSLINLSKI
ncbi:hypothetical protein PPL_02845 [Heterostelium album PN500]|uniref:Uncharacterized protein n=1 Tax=Heterostelium pallidum (strain ATCC 26659 / Pp 5 / PN500) TaxID=670386 RepID=D3B379_HETP5|nr:hypothetical protein PPL_02845 [Heterostelium album PN500]EFA83777.1 hypothetical protein PPL_02845 [Heterostelium album PN500]|eukprot:XP_020435894.1 hypothetical protein PPL_02845 [Heterostelium album PN500]